LSDPAKGLIAITAAATMIPIWRSGGRGNLTFWGWVWNHTVWGPPVEYIPAEDYESEICLRLTRRR